MVENLIVAEILSITTFKSMTFLTPFTFFRANISNLKTPNHLHVIWLMRINQIFVKHFECFYQNMFYLHVYFSDKNIGSGL